MSTGEEQQKVDRFQIVGVLAQGSHTQVLEVIDGAQRLAMKILNEHSFADATQKAALKAEYQIGKQFDHPNIIKYHELVTTRKHGYFTMELFRAPNLKSQIYNDLRSVHLRIKRLVELVCLALEHVHEKGWLHKDIKPDNILVNRASEIRLIDFSLGGKGSSAFGKLFSRRPKLVQGTRSYMSPEQIMGQPLTPATDQYSFGVTLFECLTGQTPFKGATPKDLLVRHVSEKPPSPSYLNPNVTPEMDRLVLKLMEKKPDKRFKNLPEFLMEFRRITVFKEAIEEGEEKKVEKADFTLGERRDSRSDANKTATDKADKADREDKAAALAAGSPGKAPPVKGAAPAAKAPPPAAGARPPAGPPPAGQPRPAAPPAAGAVPQPQGRPPVKAAATPPRPTTAPPAGQSASSPPPAGQPAQRPPTAPGRPTTAPPAAQPAAGRPPAGAPAMARPPAGPQAAPARPQPAPAGAGRPGPPPARPTTAPPAPGSTRPQAPARPAAKAPPPKPDEGMNIEDLPSFDELPPVI